MSRVWVGVLAFAGGVAVGLALAKQYARAKVSDDIHAGLASVGLAGGAIESLADEYLVPRIVS